MTQHMSCQSHHHCLHSQDLNIQWSISPVILDQISSNFASIGRIRVLQVCKVWSYLDDENPLFPACENDKTWVKFRYISVLAVHLWLYYFEMNFALFVGFFGLLCGLARPLIYIYMYLYIYIYSAVHNDWPPLYLNIHWFKWAINP